MSGTMGGEEPKIGVDAFVVQQLDDPSKAIPNFQALHSNIDLATQMAV